MHFNLQLFLCQHNVRCVFVINGTNVNKLRMKIKIFTLVKTAITIVIDYEKDRLKDHWRVNVIINKS